MQLRNTLDRVACTLVLTAIGIVLAWSLWPKVSSWHRRQAVLHLAAQMEVLEDADVKIPLRQIAQFGPESIEPLVLAAASERGTVVAVARQILTEKFANWQLRTMESGDLDSSTWIAQLAASLREHIPQFGGAGKQWAETLTLCMVHFSDEPTFPYAGKLLSDCNQILAAIPPQGPRMRSLAAAAQRPAEEMPMSPVPPMPLDVLAVPSERALEARRAAAAARLKLVEKQASALAKPAYASPRRPKTDWLLQ